MPQDNSPERAARTATLEAFADTIVPGAKRSPDDRAVAGVSADGGAVAAGAIELLESFAPGVSAGLDPLSQALNGHARAYAEEQDLSLDDSVPEFVALSFVALSFAALKAGALNWRLLNCVISLPSALAT